ncbi:unnamed protein product, partial [Choristocarpus tenellus]
SKHNWKNWNYGATGRSHIVTSPISPLLVSVNSMTEFKRTSEELEKIAELVESIEHDAMIPPPMKLLELQTAKERMEGELAAKVTRFEKRLGEKDPVSGVARYGENMRMKV